MPETSHGDDRQERLVREAVQRHWIGAFAPTAHVDPLLLLVVVGLSGLGLVMIYSATFARQQARAATRCTSSTARRWRS